MADDTRTSQMQGALAGLVDAQAQAARTMLAPFLDALPAGATQPLPQAQDAVQWADVAQRLQAMWLDYQAGQAARPAAPAATPPMFGGLAGLVALGETWLKQLPMTGIERQERLWTDLLGTWQSVLGQFGIGPGAATEPSDEPRFPRHDPRFADAAWREQPLFAMLHQTYLMLAEHVTAMAEEVEGLDPAKQAQLRFTTRAIVDALSPSNFPLTNPVAIARARETRGESLVQGMENLLGDLTRGQLTHTPADAFRLGENIAVTPGKVIHRTALFELIHYAPTTETVLAVPLVIFPPWINRFYILDLNPKKSFVKWAVDQGVSVFMVSWKSADEGMGEITWDDYAAAQVEAIELVRDRLEVPAVHALGYCVAGTTLAATLSVMAQRGEAARVKSATFFTAQVDFERAGDLKHFIGDQTLETIAQLGPNGVVDGRYLAATFNLLRGNDLIWNYVAKNYLMGEAYPAFDLLHWNGDVTNLPARWHEAYLRDLYRDNRLVEPGALTMLGLPIDLTRIQTPAFIQAGREDHIAPPESVWELTRYLAGPWTFVLAGSGHIAGVVNPPAAAKYQYWINDADRDTLEGFIAGAVERPGSWWPLWMTWLRGQDDAEVPADGRRVPGEAGPPALDDAPGRYVRLR